MNATTTSDFALQTFTPAAEKIEIQANNIVAQAKAILIVDETSMQRAVDLLATVKGDIRSLEKDKETIYRPAKQVVDEITRRYKDATHPFSVAETLLKTAIGKYEQEQRAKREAQEREERRLREEAALREAERTKQQLAEQEAMVKKQAEDEALRLSQEGKGEEAAAVMANSLEAIKDIRDDAQAATLQQFDRTAEPTAAPPASTRSAGGSMVTTKMIWDFEVQDIAKVPARFLTIDGPAVREAIRAGERDVAGLRIFQKPSISVK